MLPTASTVPTIKTSRLSCSGMALLVARLVPDDEKVCSGRDLALVLGQAQLPEDEARAWRRDLQAARKTLTAPGDKWR